AEAIENQVKNVLLDYNHFENIALVKKGLHETFMHTFMHMLVAALVVTIISDFEDSTVTYTTVSSPYEGRSGDVSPGVDGPPVMPEDPYAYVPLPAAASPTTESPGYISKSDPDKDPEEDDDKDPEEDPADYPVDHDDDDDKEEEEEPSGDDADEEQDEDDDDEEEEHPASADSIPPPPALCVMTRIYFRPQPPTLSFTKEDAERFLAMPIPLPLPLTLLSSPLPQIPSPPLSASPPILPIPLPTASPPLQLLSSDCKADRPEVTLPPRKRLSIVHCLGYKAGKSSVTAAARPIEGRRADYGFVDSVEAEIRQQRAEDIGYGIRDTWIDPRDVAKEEALTTLEGVNTRVTELAAVQERDTHDIYGVIEDTQVTVMSDSEDSMVTYTTVSSPYEGRSEDVSPGVNGPPVMLKDLYAYVIAAFQALPPSNYVPGLEEPEQATPSPVYIPYVPELVYPKYIPPEDDVFPVVEQPLPATASPTAESLGYIPEFDLDEDSEEDDDEDQEDDPADYPADHDDEKDDDEDPEEDPADYPADHDDEEEPSGDDADEEQDEDDDDEEEEHPASADSILPLPALCVTARMSFKPQPLTLSFTKEDAERFLAMYIPPPSPLTLLSSPLPQIPSPHSQHHPLSSPYHYLLHHHPYSYYLLTVEQIDLRLPYHLKREDIGYGIRDTWIDPRDVARRKH
nr:hypothetical protein [Tanacetum cinerariifolium]